MYRPICIHVPSENITSKRKKSNGCLDSYRKSREQNCASRAPFFTEARINKALEAISAVKILEKAVNEMGNIYSPWAENSFTKEEIRTVARGIGLSVSDKPPLACLASRTPFREKNRA
ncbi:MAG: hypothetical protein QXV01_07505 [Candidatus Bathyarchaeia archaeon]